MADHWQAPKFHPLRDWLCGGTTVWWFNSQLVGSGVWCSMVKVSRTRLPPTVWWCSLDVLVCATFKVTAPSWSEMAGWISTGTVQQVIGLGWLKYAGVRSTCLVTRNFACTFSITLHCNVYTGTNSSESWWAIANKIPRSILFCRRTGDKKNHFRSPVFHSRANYSLLIGILISFQKHVLFSFHSCLFCLKMALSCIAYMPSVRRSKKKGWPEIPLKPTSNLASDVPGFHPIKIASYSKQERMESKT